MSYFINNSLWVKDFEMKTIQNSLFLAQSSHKLPLHPRRQSDLPPFSPLAPHSLSSSITLPILIRRSLPDVWMVSVGLCVCLVLQTPSHLAGPPVVPGSMPGMQGMAQWTIRRKFPAADRTKSPETTDITREKKKRMTTKSGLGEDGTGCLDRHRSRFDTKTINTVTVTVLGNWEQWQGWDDDTWKKGNGMCRDDWREIGEVLKERRVNDRRQNCY